VKFVRNESSRLLTAHPRVGATILDKTGFGVKNRTAQLRLVLGLRVFATKKSDVEIFKKIQQHSS
jgi:hypothetical protein